jgi:hypothetical protein
MTGTIAGKVAIEGTYSGDPNNQGSSGNAGLTIRKASTVTVIACTQSSFSVGKSTTTCTATVTGGYSSQTGTVTWSKVSGKGSVMFSPTTCTLPGTCSAIVTIAATHTGSLEIKAVYSGDFNNLGSLGTLLLTIS